MGLYTISIMMYVLIDRKTDQYVEVVIVCNASPSYTQYSMHPNCLHDNSNITGNWAIVCIYFNIIVTRSRGTTGDVTQHQFVRHYISIHIPGNWYNCNGLSHTIWIFIKDLLQSLKLIIYWIILNKIFKVGHLLLIIYLFFTLLFFKFYAHYTINTASDADNLKIEQKHTY
jgi:hypothetical protein